MSLILNFDCHIRTVTCSFWTFLLYFASYARGFGKQPETVGLGTIHVS